MMMDVNARNFSDLYNSAIGKAGRLGQSVCGVTLGPNAIPYEYNDAAPCPQGLPQRTSTPKKSPRLSIEAIRNYYEIKSARDVQRKILQSELSINRKLESDKNVMNLEMASKVSGDGIVRRMSRLYEQERLKQLSDHADAEKKLHANFPNKMPGVDKVAENRALERSEKIKQNLEEAKRKNVEKKKLMESGATWIAMFNATYQDILKLVADSLDQKSLYEAIDVHLSHMKSAVQFSEAFEAKNNKGEITEWDLNNADSVLTKLRKSLAIITVEADNINQCFVEAKRKAEDEESSKVEREKIKAKEIFSKYSDEESLQLLSVLKEILVKTNLELEPLFKDKKMEQYRFQLQKAVTVPVNAISPDSPQHMMDKYRKLHGLLSGSRVEGCSVSTNDHPLGGLFVKDLLARLFVKQGEKAVSSKPDAAYALASILVNLWVDFPDFGVLVRAHFFDKCPYLVPMFMPKCEGQSEEDYYKSMGYIVRNEKIEEPDMFLKRMEGIMRLYASVIITLPRKPNQQTPLGLIEAWRWSAAFLNIEPRPDISPIMLVSFLEVTGYEMWRSYGKQFNKILAYMCKDYFPILEKNTPKNRRGRLTRFETFLEQAVKTASIPQPVGLLPTNFW